MGCFVVSCAVRCFLALSSWLLGFEQGGVQQQVTKLTGQVNADQQVFGGQAFGKLLLAHTTRSCISLLRKGTYIGVIS